MPHHRTGVSRGRGWSLLPSSRPDRRVGPDGTRRHRDARRDRGLALRPRGSVYVGYFPLFEHDLVLGSVEPFVSGVVVNGPPGDEGALSSRHATPGDRGERCLSGAPLPH